jgi:formylglycine-generating enzyme required for sulfatase activity
MSLLRHARALVPPCLALAVGCGPGDVDDSRVVLLDDTGPAWTRADCEDRTVCEEGLCWTAMCGGSFAMGNPIGRGEADEHPQHPVAVRNFDILQAEVTVDQYRLCVDDGACEPWPDSEEIPSRCSGDEEGEGDHPMNCLDWFMAEAFCAWAGGSLPTEAQWEYAARSRGQDVTYPWGDDEPSCELLQMHEQDCCGTGTSCPVCSFPAGNTDQGLCDMAGNIFEWTADWYHNSYVAAPRNATAWVIPEYSLRTLRGGAIGSGVGYRVRNRTYHEPDFFYSGMGARCVREWSPVE